MKKYVAIAVSMLVAGSFALNSAGIASASHSQAGSTPPKLKKGVTLSIWDFFGTGSSERATEERIIAQFTKATGIKVATPQNPTNANNKFLLSAPTGQAPDLIGLPHDQLATLIAGKVIAPVPAWAWTNKSAYIKAAVQAPTVNGKAYAMPWAIETTGLFYNKSLVKASTFKPAKGQKYLTWSKLIPTLQKIKAAGKMPLAFDPTNFYFDYAFLSGYGGYVFKYVSKKGFQWQSIGLDSTASVKGITFIRDLFDGSSSAKYKLIPSTMTSSTGDGLFEKGDLAIDYTGPWNEQNFQKANISFGFAPLPSYDGKKPLRPFSGVQEYAVNAFSKNKNEAFALLKYLTQNMQIPEFKSSGRIPVFKSALASKTVQSDPVAKGLAAAALAASPMPNIPEMQQVWSPAGNAIGQVAQGKATPADAAQVMVQQIKAAIAKAHSG